MEPSASTRTKVGLFKSSTASKPGVEASVTPTPRALGAFTMRGEPPAPPLVKRRASAAPVRPSVSVISAPPLCHQ